MCVVSNRCGDGGSMSSVRTAVHTAKSSASFKGLGRAVLEGPGGEGRGGGVGWREAALLIPQDGVLVVQLQMLHSRSAALLSAAVLVLDHLKGLLHFSVLASLHVLGGGQ